MLAEDMAEEEAGSQRADRTRDSEDWFKVARAHDADAQHGSGGQEHWLTTSPRDTGAGRSPSPPCQSSASAGEYV